MRTKSFIVATYLAISIACTGGSNNSADNNNTQTPTPTPVVTPTPTSTPTPVSNKERGYFRYVGSSFQQTPQAMKLGRVAADTVIIGSGFANRKGHNALLLSDNQHVLIAGGTQWASINNGTDMLTPENKFQMFDILTEKFTNIPLDDSLANLTIADLDIYCPSMIETPNGVFIITDGGSWRLDESFFFYNFSTGKIERKTIPSANFELGFALKFSSHSEMINGKIIVVSKFGSRTITRCMILDPLTLEVLKFTDDEVILPLYSAYYTDGKYLYVIGGESPVSNDLVSDIYRIDENLKIDLVGQLPELYTYQGICKYDDENIIIMGGNRRTAPGETQIPTSDRVWEYDLTNGTFKQLAKLPAPGGKYSHPSLLQSGLIFMGGGTTSQSFDSVTSQILFDKVSGNTWATNPMLCARIDHVATYLSNGRVLITGGTTGNTTEPEIFESAIYIKVPQAKTFAYGSTLQMQVDYPTVNPIQADSVVWSCDFGTITNDGLLTFPENGNETKAVKVTVTGLDSSNVSHSASIILNLE